MIPIYIIGGIIALPFVVALFVSKRYLVQREIAIEKPAGLVFNYIRFLRNQEQYSKWVMTDPDMKKEFKGVDGSVGFIYAWDGNNKAGKGEQEIKSLVPNRSVECEIRFIKPFEGVASTTMLLEEATKNSTKVIWSMTGESKYPMNLATLFLRGTLEKDLEISLTNLKNILEIK